jgi:hypothetical protein
MTTVSRNYIFQGFCSEYEQRYLNEIRTKDLEGPTPYPNYVMIQRLVFNCIFHRNTGFANTIWAISMRISMGFDPPVLVFEGRRVGYEVGTSGEHNPELYNNHKVYRQAGDFLH